MHSASIRADERNSSPPGSQAWQPASAPYHSRALSRSKPPSAASWRPRSPGKRDGEGGVGVGADAQRGSSLSAGSRGNGRRNLGQRRQAGGPARCLGGRMARQLGGEHQHPGPAIRPLEAGMLLCVGHLDGEVDFGELAIEQRATAGASGERERRRSRATSSRRGRRNASRSCRREPDAGHAGRARPAAPQHVVRLFGTPVRRGRGRCA